MASSDSGQTEYIDISSRKPAHFAAGVPIAEDAGEATVLMDAAEVESQATTAMDDAPTTMLGDAPTTVMEAGPTTVLDDAASAEETMLVASDLPTVVLDETPQTELRPADPVVDEDDEALVALKNLEERRRQKRRSKWLKIAAGAALVAAVGGWFGLRSVVAPQQDDPTAPSTMVVTKQNFQTSVQGTGALQPASTTVVTPEIDGIIDTVNVSEGQMVGAGDVLFTIRSEQIDKAISNAADSLSEAQSNLGEASRSYGETQSAIAKDRAAYQAASAQAAADKAKAQEAYNKAYHQHDDAIAAAKRLFDEATAKEQATLAAQTSAYGVYAPLKVTFDAAKEKYEQIRDYFDEAVVTRDYIAKKPVDERTNEEKKRLEVLDGPEARMNYGLLELNSLRTMYKELYGEYLINVDDPWPISDPRNPCLKKAMDEAAAACTTPRETYEQAVLAHDDAAEALDAAQAVYNDALAAADAAAQAAAATIPIAVVPAFSEASAQAQLDGAQASVNSASNAVNAAQKAYDEAVAAADKKTVKSPIAGTVVSVRAVAGQAVGSGASGTGTLVQIADISKMEATIQVNEIDISEIKAGQKATCTFSALPGVELAGVVTSVASTATGSGEGSFGGGVVTYAVNVRIDKPGTKVKTGMTATVNIMTQDVSDVLVVPAMALEEVDGRAFVYVVTNQETYETERREVTLGARSTTDVVVTSGLTEGDVILLSGSEVFLNEEEGASTNGSVTFSVTEG